MKNFVKVLAVIILAVVVMLLGCSCSTKTNIQSEVVSFGFEPHVEEEIDINEFTFEKVGETWDNSTTITYWQWHK